MIDLSKVEVVNDPFPYILIDNAFSDETFQGLLSEFPSTAEKEAQMGNRKKVDSGDPFGKANPEFHAMLETKPTWKRLWDWMNSQQTQKSMFRKFSEGMREWQCKAGTTSKLGKDTYVHMDWSEAGDGYWREVHTDREVRIVNFLVFFNDKDWDNGDFEAYSSEGVTDFRQKQFFDGLPENIKLDKTVEAVANRAVFFLSTPDSYHAVSKQANTNSLRKFIYGSWSGHGDMWGKSVR